MGKGMGLFLYPLDTTVRKPWLSPRRIRRVRRGAAGPDDPPPHQGSLPSGAASLGFYFRLCSLPDLFPSCLPRSHFDASGVPCDLTSRQAPSYVSLVHCPSAHSAAHTAAVPPCRCRPQLCQTLLHLTHLTTWPGAPLAFFLALVLGLGLAVVLIPATDCEPTLAAEASMGHLELRVRCSCGALLASASAQLCLPERRRKKKTICMHTVQVCLSS